MYRKYFYWINNTFFSEYTFYIFKVEERLKKTKQNGYNCINFYFITWFTSILVQFLKKGHKKQRTRNFKDLKILYARIQMHTFRENSTQILMQHWKGKCKILQISAKCLISEYFYGIFIYCSAFDGNRKIKSVFQKFLVYRDPVTFHHIFLH